MRIVLDAIDEANICAGVRSISTDFSTRAIQEYRMDRVQ
jgi:hypothetical protein